MLTVVLTAVQVQQCSKIHFHDRKCVCIAADIVVVIIKTIEVRCRCRRFGCDGVRLS